MVAPNIIPMREDDIVFLGLFAAMGKVRKKL